MAETVWLTGKPSAGKTTLSEGIRERLFGGEIEFLDGDELRASPLSVDLGFSDEDRMRQAQRVAYVAQRLNAHGVRVVVALVSPMRAMREAARQIIGDGFVEVYVRCSSEVCQERDVKGLYARAARGEIQGLTGFDAEYEEPTAPEVEVHTEVNSVGECVSQILEKAGWW